jgi:anaerobic magnesium-protoporphyrin IX monomethyl ester cyclase
MTSILMCYPTPSTTSPQKNPALSIFYPGAALENAGHYVSYWDERYDSKQDLVAKISKVDYVGVSSKTGEQLKGAKMILMLAKESAKKTIFGGIHPSLLPDQCIRELYIDYIVVGEGEITIVDLIDALENNRSVGLGVMTKRGFTGSQRQLTGEDIPSPITKKTKPYFEKSYPSDVMLQSSRGCPFECTFCYNVAFHQSKYRPIPLSNWEDDLDKLPGIKWLQMGEDWAGPKRRILEIARILHKKGIGWLPGLRADQIDEELAGELAAYGCTGVAIGIESGSPTVLMDIVNKQETVDAFINSARALTKVNLKAQYYFILGFPGETEKDRTLTYNFADKLYKIHGGNVTMIFYSFTPLPGTPLYEKAITFGIKLPKNIDGWSNYSLNKSFSDEYSNIYHIAGLTFHRGKGDKTDRNFPGLKRLLIKPFELLCMFRWKLRYWNYFTFEKHCIEKLLNWTIQQKSGEKNL